MNIKINNASVDLPVGLKIEVQDSNPAFNDRGSQSIPVTVPANDKNCRLLGFPTRLDTVVEPNNPEQKVAVIDGSYMRTGVMNVTGAGRKSGISFNIGFDNSTAYAKWQNRRLCDIENLPEYIPVDTGGESLMTHLLDYLYNIYQAADAQSHDLAVFPIVIDKHEVDGTTSWEMLNMLHNDKQCPLEQPRNIKRVIDGKMTDLTVPEGYAVSPFLRVWRVVELIFADLGLEILSNPFKEDIELARLVVLNNAADAICNSKIKYCDLMPDCTVSEFLNALWVRFGMVYDIKFDAATVEIRLMRDIVHEAGSERWDDFASDLPDITYNNPQYIKLSAKTSIDGAAPSHERFEDFIRGLEVGQVHLGVSVSNWINQSPRQDHDWDGDFSDDYYDEEDPGDPGAIDDPFDDPSDDPIWDDDDRYEGPEYESISVPKVPLSLEYKATQTTSADAHDAFLAREFITGKWYKLDAFNGVVSEASSGFFSWDPQPEGLEEMDLSSDDEFVPVLSIGAHYYPAYLFGARHFHTYIIDSDKSERSEDQTPLAFMFAYNRQGTTVGRLYPEGGDGKPMVCDDGVPSLSLLFQFKDGLFAKFWTGYDEILRHSNRSVSVQMLFRKADVPCINMLHPILFKNIRCLPDTLTYSLPSANPLSIDVKMRTLTTQGHYDIVKEQNIPDFSVAQRHLEFRLIATTYTDVENVIENKQRGVNLFVRQTNYKSHGVPGDNWYIGAGGLQFVSKSTCGMTWHSDKRLVPYSINDRRSMTYNANVTYDVYEIHDMGEAGYEISSNRIGQVIVPVKYTVTLQAVWVYD